MQRRSPPMLQRMHCSRAALVLSATLFCSTCSVSQPNAAPKRPNIVVFLVDDMGWQETSVPFHTEPTALNRRYRTPAMERLAATGMKFTQAYASAVCSPSRLSLMTGQNVARHRVTNWTLQRGWSPYSAQATLTPPQWNVNGYCADPAIERTMQGAALPELLRGAGYRTIHVGKAHFGAKDTPGADPRHLGFDVNLGGHAAGGPGSYHGEHDYSAAWRKGDRIWDVPGLAAYHGTDTNLTEALTREAVREVEQAHAADTPFFLYLAHYAIHGPWEPDARFVPRYLDAGLPQQQAALASMVEGMDKSLGDVLDTLDRLGIADDTLVLFLSDNGSPQQCPPNLPLRGHKLSPYEGGVRIPMLARWPGITTAGSTCPTPVVIEDCHATLLAAAGVPATASAPFPVDGESFVAQLGGEPRAHQRAFVWHYPHHYSGQAPWSAIRVGDWKLVYHHADQRRELFDLAHDLGEQHDLATREPERVTTLAAQLGGLLRNRGAQMPTRKVDGAPVPWPDALVASAVPR